jgi:hypothetical protein
MRIPDCVKAYPELLPLFEKADHMDVKTVTGRKTLREFLSGGFSYQPGWVTFLYGVRGVFVRFLGMKQGGIPRMKRIPPEQIPMQAGQHVAFFKVTKAKVDSYWWSEVDDTHLKAGILVVEEQLENGQKRFNLITLVYYHKWTGPVYFNVIRPFHHLVVNGMARAGVA